MVTQPPRDARRATSWHVTPGPVRAAGVVLAMTAAVALMCLAFAWPAVLSTPHDLPIGVVGPQPAVTRVQAQLNDADPGGFAVAGYPDQDALRAAIRHRDVYGGLLVGDQGTTLLTASGGSPMIARLLTQAGDGIAAHSGKPLHTEDLAPLPPADPYGAGLAAVTLPITLAGLLPAIVLLLDFPRQAWLRFAATAVFSLLAALTIAIVLRHALGSIDHNLAGVTAGLTLGILAMSLPVLGLGSLFGWIGLTVGVVVAVLLGNPLSGLMNAPELLARGWGAFGQLLPQGANATLLRSTAYFDNAGAGTAVLVLAGWTAFGVLLIVIAGLRDRA